MTQDTKDTVTVDLPRASLGVLASAADARARHYERCRNPNFTPPAGKEDVNDRRVRLLRDAAARLRQLIED